MKIKQLYRVLQPVAGLQHRINWLRATACNAIARLFYGRGVIPSVRPSVTLMYCVKTTQLRIIKSSLCDSPESLVSNEVILVPLAE